MAKLTTRAVCSLFGSSCPRSSRRYLTAIRATSKPRGAAEYPAVADRITNSYILKWATRNPTGHAVHLPGVGPNAGRTTRAWYECVPLKLVQSRASIVADPEAEGKFLVVPW